MKSFFFLILFFYILDLLSQMPCEVSRDLILITNKDSFDLINKKLEDIDKKFNFIKADSRDTDYMILSIDSIDLADSLGNWTFVASKIKGWKTIPDSLSYRVIDLNVIETDASFKLHAVNTKEILVCFLQSRIAISKEKIYIIIDRSVCTPDYGAASSCECYTHYYYFEKLGN